MTSSPQLTKAPDLQATQWFNTAQPIELPDLLGRVVVIESFQMLCPGCVSHGLPQASEVAATFSPRDVAVIGLHTVFEHHDAMQPTALKAFLYEYKIAFPVGVDAPGEESHLPKTMQAYAMGGTPTITLIDRQGYLRHQHLGRVSDMALGAEIMSLVEGDKETQPAPPRNKAELVAGCNDDGCAYTTS